MEPQHRKKKMSAGCVVALVIGIVLAVVAVLAVPLMIFLLTPRMAVTEEAGEGMGVRETVEQAISYSSSGSPETLEGSDAGRVVLHREELGNVMPAEFGEKLNREHFVAVMVDEDATELMRKQFAEKANGRKVKWLFKVHEIEAPGQDGEIRASLELPYTIQSENMIQSGSIRLRGQFAPDEAAGLARIRRGQAVTVEGELMVDASGRGAGLVGAKVVE